MDANPFVVNRLRAKPVTYTVEISHFVVNGTWQMSVQVNDVSEDDVNRARVADDLRVAADLITAKIEGGGGSTNATPL